jgi:predicted GIY-YIG superfamily endonuclease
VHVGSLATGKSLCGRGFRIEAPGVPMPTCNRCFNLAQGTSGVVYLLCFDSPFGHAQHYMGWTSNLHMRLAHHAAGTGANLLKHVAAAGISWTLTGLVYGDRNEERRLKNRGGHARKCYACKVKNQQVGLAG